MKATQHIRPEDPPAPADAPRQGRGDGEWCCHPATAPWGGEIGCNAAKGHPGDLHAFSDHHGDRILATWSEA